MYKLFLTLLVLSLLHQISWTQIEIASQNTSAVDSLKKVNFKHALATDSLLNNNPISIPSDINIPTVPNFERRLPNVDLKNKATEIGTISKIEASNSQLYDSLLNQSNIPTPPNFETLDIESQLPGVDLKNKAIAIGGIFRKPNAQLADSLAKNKIFSKILGIEMPDTESFLKKWKPDIDYTLSLNFDFSSGNLNMIKIIPKANILIDGKLVKLNSTVGYNYALVDGKPLSNDLIFKNFFSFDLGNVLSLSTLGFAEKTATRNVDNRYKTGFGFGFDLIKKERQNIRIDLNGIYERTQYSGKRFTDEMDTAMLRIVYAPMIHVAGKHLFKSSKVKIDYDTSFLFALNQKQDYRISTNINIQIPLSKNITFLTAIVYSFESLVFQGLERDDLYLTVGLGLSDWK